MKLLCLDSNSILNRAFYGIKLLTAKDGTYTNAVYGFLNILHKLLQEVQPDCVVFAFDLKAPTFRHKMYDGYKAQRKGMPPELAQQLPIIQELLTDLGYRIVTREGFEADDILGSYAALCEKEGHHCWIATGDRDSLQLIGPNTTVLLTTTRLGRSETVAWDEEMFREKYGTEPQGLVDIKALMGDSSDNIPGVPGIGEKTALKLMGQYGSLKRIYEELDQGTLDATKSVKEKLDKGRESAFLSQTLATIDRSVPLECSVCDCARAQGDPAAAYRLLTRLEMPSIIKKLGLEAPSGALGEEAEPASEAAAERWQAVRDPQALSQALAEEKELAFLYRTDAQGQPEALAVCAPAQKKLVYLNREEPRLPQLWAQLLASDTPKLTFDSKTLYSWGFAHQAPVRAIREDGMLSAYLLSANASEYTMSGLLSQYKVEAPALSLEEIPQDEQPFVENCAALPGLCAALNAEIVENGQETLLRQVELPLAKVLASMEELGFEVDDVALREYGVQLDRSIEQLQQSIWTMAGEEFNINSPKQLGEILFEKMQLPAKKKTKTGWSTNAEVLEGLRGKDPIIDAILEYRKVTKLKSTYVDGLLKVLAPDGRIHSHFNQTDTRTGRLSSTEPNLQNIPVRTELGSQLRRFFRAKEGCVLVDADYSQIELRVLAHIADDKNMQEAFNSGEDIHTNTASQVFGLPPLYITPEMRRKAKAVNFGIVYGIGAFSLSQDIGVTVAEADHYIKQYLSTFSGVRQYMEDTIAFAKEHGYIATLLGRRRYLPEIRSSNRNIVAFGQRVAMNTPIQGTAADIIKIAMIRVYNRLEREGLASRLILQVHDELIVEAPEAEAGKVEEILRQEMEQAMDLHVKLLADVHQGKTWYDAK